MQTCDVLVIGSGFGGCLLAAALQQRGLSTIIVDRATHPRFAIGESSTPLADQTLQRMALDYDLPELIPLCRYATWKKSWPDITCGLKRGFTYLDHTSRDGRVGPDQLLVAASRTDARSDTHWLRSDVDHLFARVAAQRGAVLIGGATYRLQPAAGGWLATGSGPEDAFRVQSGFVVDASAAAAVVLNALGVADGTTQLKTCSSAAFGHFRGVKRNQELLSQFQVAAGAHPFRCDAAAVHHVLQNGWMWQLRFDDDTVSAGYMRRGSHALLPHDWQELLDRHPYFKAQFHNAELIRVAGLQCSGRVQRLRLQAAGTNWAALPSTVGFIDPLHSTGIAHTLFGVRRLAALLSNDEWSDVVADEYSRQTIGELRLIDELVEGCYAALPSFRLWSDWCMLYFAAVTSMEQDGMARPDFLRARDADFRAVLRAARSQLQQVINRDRSPVAVTEFEAWLRTRIAPWNRVGLLDSADGMYADTAAP